MKTSIIHRTTLAKIVRRIDPRYTLVSTWMLTGGVSAQIIGLEITYHCHQTRRLLLRRYGTAELAQNPQIAADEFRLLQHLHTARLPVPVPVYVDQSGELIPSPYIVQEYVEGKTEFAPDDLPNFIRQCAHLCGSRKR